MNRYLVFAALFLSLFIFTAPAVYAQENFRQGETSILSQDEVINGNYFSTGERVEILGTVNGDAYVAGGKVIINGTINGDLLAAGGELEINGKVTGDIRAAGGNLSVRGEAGDDITVLGGNIDIEENAVIAGSVVGAGGDLKIFAPVNKDITVAGGNVDIGNNVGSNVTAAAGQLWISPNAKINGNINYWSDEKISLSPTASVSGQISQHETPQRDREMERQIARGIQTGATIMGLLTALFVGLLFTMFLPNVTQRVVTKIKDRPWVSLFFGFAVLVLGPILVIALMVTVIGIPLGLLLGAFYIFWLFFSRVFVAVLLGQYIFEKTNNKVNVHLSLLLGLLLLTIAGWVPVVGGLIGFISMLVGLGALVLTQSDFFSDLRAKKVL